MDLDTTPDSLTYLVSAEQAVKLVVTFALTKRFMLSV